MIFWSWRCCALREDGEGIPTPQKRSTTVSSLEVRSPAGAAIASAKAVKLYAWEEQYLEQIGKRRDEQVDLVTKYRAYRLPRPGNRGATAARIVLSTRRRRGRDADSPAMRRGALAARTRRRRRRRVVR